MPTYTCYLSVGRDTHCACGEFELVVPWYHGTAPLVRTPLRLVPYRCLGCVAPPLSGCYNDNDQWIRPDVPNTQHRPPTARPRPAESPYTHRAVASTVRR